MFTWHCFTINGEFVLNKLIRMRIKDNSSIDALTTDMTQCRKAEQKYT